jgi:hypothetical protein
MVDEEEAEESESNEEAFEDEEQEMVQEKNQKPTQPKTNVKKILDEAVTQPKVQIVEEEITLSLLNRKLNFIISQLTDKQ